MANGWKILGGIISILVLGYVLGFWELHMASDASGSVRALVVFDNLVWCQDSGAYAYLGTCELVESALQYEGGFPFP